MKDDTFYFSHDYNARNDMKIKKLLSKHGYSGYGIFWAIVEELYNNANALRLDYDCIAFDLRIDVELVKSIINDFELFVFNGEFFGSLSIQKRLDERSEKSKKARNSAKMRWGNTNAMRTHSDGNADAMRPQYDGNAIKERKGKENKVKENKKESVFSIDWVSEKEKMKSDTVWLEGYVMRNKYSMERLNNRLVSFISYLEDSEDIKPCADAKKHFVNWNKPDVEKFTRQFSTTLM